MATRNPFALDELKALYTELQKNNSQLLIEYRKDIKNKIKKLLPLLLLERRVEKSNDSIEIIDLTIKILLILTSPLEEFTPNLLSVKELFTDNFLTKSIVDHVKFLIEFHPHQETNQSIQNGIELLSNILYLPELYTNRYFLNIKQQIIWNLFIEGIDKIIIYLIDKRYFAKSIVQFLALLYKNQHVGTLQKLLNCWLESSLSESSDDDSKITIRQEGFSQLNVSEFSSENNNNYPKKGSNQCRTYLQKNKNDINGKSDVDYGYVTQFELVENQDDEQLFYCFNKQFAKDYYDTTLKYNFNKKMQIRKTKRTFKPTNMNDLFTEFTVDFLLKGYNTLVNDLYLQYFKENFDPTHLFWLISYFLKFPSLVELNLEYINNVLSIEIISFLVFQGVKLTDDVKRNLTNNNLKPAHFVKLHFIVLCINEFLQLLFFYKGNVTLCSQSRNYISKLEKELSELKDLRSLYWILLENFNKNSQNKLYLKDLIISNNNYLLLLDGQVKSSLSTSNRLIEYLKRFSTHKIMANYGYLLENFQENGKYLNDCIFTMMHHIAGDLNNVSILLQKGILSTFIDILESDFEFCQDWIDLIKYVINEYYNKYRGELENKGMERYKKSSKVLQNIKEEKFFENFESLRVFIQHEYPQHVLWIQEFLIKLYYIKFLIKNSEKLISNAPIAEAIIYNNLVANHPVPLVPYNAEQQLILENPIFICFLQGLGFQSINNGLFLTISNSWTSSHLLNTAQQLGPIQRHLKFEISICSRTTTDQILLKKYAALSNLPIEKGISIEEQLKGLSIDSIHLNDK